MEKFIENFKMFIEHYKIKKNVIAIKTGYDKNKLSRLLNGKQVVNANEMDVLAKSVGKKATFFMESIKFNDFNLSNENKIAFSVGAPTKEKEEYANKLFDLLEHIDLILGMENKLKKCHLDEV